jgi:hypothetical protein
MLLVGGARFKKFRQKGINHRLLESPSQQRRERRFNLKEIMQ